jgi:hypothetical protein
MKDRRVSATEPTPARVAMHREHLRQSVLATCSDVRLLAGRATRWGLDVPPEVRAAARALAAWADSLKPHP